MPADSSSHGEALRATLEELSRNVAEPSDIDSALRKVTASAVALLGQVASASVLLIDRIDQQSEYRSVASTSSTSEQLDRVQYRLHEGPCWDAATSNPVTVANDLRTDRRWPNFSAAAVEQNVLSMVSFRLYTYDHRVGALNLFATEPDAFDEDAETTGAMLAGNAAAALIAHDRSLQFRSALASRDVIGQAKGMIMERFSVDAARAFELLAKLSQDTNTPVVRIAADIIERGPDQRR